MDIANFESGSPSLGNAIYQCVCASAPKVNKMQQKLTTMTAKSPYCNCLYGTQSYWQSQRLLGYSRNPCILRHPNVHNRDHNRPSTIPIPRELNPVQTVPSYTVQVHLNVIHLRRGLPSCLLSSGVHIKTWHKLFFSLMRATCSSHLILIDMSLLTVHGLTINTKVPHYVIFFSFL